MDDIELEELELRGVNRDRNEAVEDGQRNRQRVILAPMEDCLLNSQMITRTREVSISSLSGDEDFEMNMNRNYIDVQLIRIITPKKEQKHIYILFVVGTKVIVPKR